MIPLLSFSQQNYPKQILYEGDSLVLITPHQLTILNYSFISADECKELSQGYEQEINLVNKKLTTFMYSEDNLRKSLNIQWGVNNEQKLQITELNKVINNKNKQLKLTKILTIISFGAGSYLTYQLVKP